MEEQVFLRHMEDLARRAAASGRSKSSRFLSPAEAETVRRAFSRRSDVSLSFEGGADSAERTIAFFIPEDAEWETPPAERIAALRVDYRKTDTLTHRDVLGALMSLGIEREVVGDILCPGEPPAYILCLSDMARFITENLGKIGGVGVSVAPAERSALPCGTARYSVSRDTVASLRLDAVLSSAFRISRGEAAELIRSRRVSLSHRPCDNPAEQVAEGDVLSVKGLGRAKLLSVGNTSRKGRIWIETGRYV